MSKPKTLEVSEAVATILDEAELNYRETMLVVMTIAAASIDSYSSSLDEAEASLHQLYRALRTQFIEMDNDGKLAYQKKKEDAEDIIV